MIGNPKYKVGDKVKFSLAKQGIPEEIIGSIYIVDAYGTFEQDKEVSYDIMVDKFLMTDAPCLVKHVRESGVSKVN